MSEPERQTDETPTPSRQRVHTPLALRLLGLRRREGRWIRIRPSLWGWTLIMLLVVLAGGIGFAEYSMHPDFCRSCHIMEPYYVAWHESTHSDIPCGDCHFEPGWQSTVRGKFEASSQAVKYITNTYGSKPHAEVRDVSCLREGCHAHRLLEGDVAWTTTTERGDPITIRFDHTPHLGELRRGKQLRCVSCHSQMVQGRHIAVTLDTCYVCHFKGLEHGRDEEVLGGCTSCHSEPKSEIRLATGMFDHADYVSRGVECVNCHSDSIKGDGEVPRQMCWTCHNKPAQIARYGEARFVHQVHVTDNKVECASCHVQIQHNLSAGVPREQRVLGEGMMLDHGGVCSQCHDQMHNGPDEMYRGTGGRGVPDMPSPMYRAQVDCIACHQQRQRSVEMAGVVGQTYVAVQDSCDHCHGNRYDDTLEVWEKRVTERLEAADIACEEARQFLSAAELEPRAALEARRLLADADHNVRFVKHGFGVHNVNYAMALLNLAIEHCREILNFGDDDNETELARIDPSDALE
ncbi:MAG: multiheme c-type cytochrome [Planctomycetota bacterium]|jgi:nitrate/TMAO reductase-like tetraheme cytochrome c subunit